MTMQIALTLIEYNPTLLNHRWRDSIDIRATILRILMEFNGHCCFIRKKTKMHNYQIVRYLSELYRLGFVEKFKPHAKNQHSYRKKTTLFYRLTEKGKQFLDIYNRMVNLLIRS